MARETLKVHSKGGFTTIYNLTIRDNNLSNKSLGLLVKLLSLPENWNFSFNGIVVLIYTIIMFMIHLKKN